MLLSVHVLAGSIYISDQASLAGAATGPPLSAHLALHWVKLLHCAGDHPDDYDTRRRLFWGTSEVHVLAGSIYMSDQASLAGAATGPPLCAHLALH